MRRRSRLAPAAVAAATGALLILAAAGNATTVAGSAGPAPTAASTAWHDWGSYRTLDHIFVIMLENHSKSSVIDDPNSPYLTSLAHTYGMADNYHGVTHPSMPNYIASIAGDNFGIQDDNDDKVVNLDRTNLVDQLEARHVSWAAYMQTLPSDKLARFGPVLADGTTASLYARKHNPFVLFDDIKNNPSRMAKIKDYSALGADLNSRKAPSFVWITPNQCSDMHGGVSVTVPGESSTPCPYGAVKDDANDAALKQKADAFVKGAVTTITHSKAWTKRSAIIIITDENDYTGNTETGGWESATACCDSPYVAAADPRISLTWPGGTYGGGVIPAIVVTATGPRHLVDHTPTTTTPC